MAGRHSFHRVRVSAFHPTVPRLVHCLVVHLALIILSRPEIGSQQQLIQFVLAAVERAQFPHPSLRVGIFENFEFA
jgi:hypothetical protein